MNEPSVLDFVKAKLKFWEKSDLHLPVPVEKSPVGDGSAVPVNMAAGEGYSEISAYPETGLSGASSGGAAVYNAPVVQESVHIPWLALAPIAIALAAQFFLEPPNRSIVPAAVLYLATAVLTLLAFWRGFLSPAAHPAARVQPDDLDMHLGEALIGVPIAAIAFILFGRNPFTAAADHFTALNVFLWLVALGLFLYAFVRADHLPNAAGWLRAKAQSLRESGWNIRISSWTVLLVIVLAVVAFFRLYRMDQIPIDMVSDHAEKLLDINDVVNGNLSIFFERNTGREPFQFYWTVLVMKIFNLPVSFFALKLGTILIGLITCYYTYKLAGLVANRWVALLSLLFVGVAYWSNIISRIALRFPLYAFFVAPLMYYLIRGLRNGSRNDFIWAGIWLGIGLNGYTSSRIVPLLVVVAIILFVLHRQSQGLRREAVMGLLLIAFFALVICLPLLRYGLEHPESVLFRSLTRLGSAERPIEGSPMMIFLSNLWAVITMFFYSNGMIWVHSIPFRPALDVVMAALFFVGVVLLLARYLKSRDWEDALMLISVPILLLPSALSIAFPSENPSLNRTSAAYVPTLIIAAIALEAMLRSLAQHLPARAGKTAAAVLGLVMVVWTVSNNYNLFFIQYDQEYTQNAWNTREIGGVVKDFAGVAGTYDTYYVVGFPYWIDSRQVAIFAGNINRDPGILPEQISATTSDPRMKMYILKPEDTASQDILSQLYPAGRLELHHSPQPGKDFDLFLAPAQSNNLP